MRTQTYLISSNSPKLPARYAPVSYRQPIELYFTARRGPQPTEAELFVTLSIPAQTELVHVPLGLNVALTSLSSYGISETADPQAHHAFRRIAAALFKAAATAVSCGTGLNPGRLPILIGAARLDGYAPIDQIIPYSQSIDTIKQLYTSGTISAKEKRTRLFALQTLIDNVRRLVLLD